MRKAGRNHQEPAALAAVIVQVRRLARLMFRCATESVGQLSDRHRVIYNVPICIANDTGRKRDLNTVGSPDCMQGSV